MRGQGLTPEAHSGTVWATRKPGSKWRLGVALPTGLPQHVAQQAANIVARAMLIGRLIN